MIKFLMRWSRELHNQNKPFPEIEIPAEVWLEFVLAIEKEIMPSLSMTVATEALSRNEIKILGFTFSREKD